MKLHPFSIRPARPADAEALIHIHFAAVHNIPIEFYPPTLLEAWSPTPSASRYEWMHGMINSSANTVLVAEIEQTIGGFAIYAPETGFIRALYIAPNFAERGVGKALLAFIEKQLLQAGVHTATLNASHNAVEFYRRAGFISLKATTQTLSNGMEMECVEMQKLL
ncbi:MAG: GNAT family N-acetyltransferase [Anaerolineales bacterium]|nr:GNAT family N-acetyltransferase [Anaerolineales bacterium]